MLCGVFLLDLVSSAVVPDEPVDHQYVSLKGQNSYTIDLKTGEDKSKTKTMRGINNTIVARRTDEWAID